MTNLSERPEFFELTPEAHPLKRGLVFAGLGRTHGTTRYHDSSQYGIHGTLTAMDPSTDWVWSSQLKRFALSIVAGQSVDCPVHPLTRIGQDASANFTVSCWVNFVGDPAASEPVVTNANRTSSADMDWRLSRRTTAPKGLWVTGISSDTGAYQSFTPKANGIWQHWCGTLQAATTTTGSKVFYLDGVAVSSMTYAAKALTTYDIGANIGDIPVQACGAMSVTDVMIWRRVLSPGDVQQIYDPSNVMLSGLIIPPPRKLWAVTAAPPTTTTRNLIIGGGVI